MFGASCFPGSLFRGPWFRLPFGVFASVVLPGLVPVSLVHLSLFRSSVRPGAFWVPSWVPGVLVSSSGSACRVPWWGCLLCRSASRGGWCLWHPAAVVPSAALPAVPGWLVLVRGPRCRCRWCLVRSCHPAVIGCGGPCLTLSRCRGWWSRLAVPGPLCGPSVRPWVSVPWRGILASWRLVVALAGSGSRGVISLSLAAGCGHSVTGCRCLILSSCPRVPW